MFLFFLSVIILGAGALLSAILSERTRLSVAIGVFAAVSGSVCGLLSALDVLLRSGSWDAPAFRWSLPYASLHFGVDHLSAFFLVVLFLLAAATAIYGRGYLEVYAKTKNLGAHWAFFNLFIASMALVLSSRSGILFLYAWEVMSLVSFFLVTFEHEASSVRRAGLTYLIATHIGTACLLSAFIFLTINSPDMEFGKLSAMGSTADAVFLLALVGFGIKAGIVPLHVWLPEAHPAAPSHVSALMSGVMIKMGIYGLLRMLTFMAPMHAWWGVLLIVVGAVSGVIGVLFALGQHDLKRLLAYHSVENIGIIVMGVGLGVLGLALDSLSIAVLGFAGALLHVVNHALFKGLLFLGAGAVYHATGTREIDRLGGLLKRMPRTALFFLVGSVAISGLPPLNGFISEFLIYSSAFNGVTIWRSFGATSAAVVAMTGLVILALALIGGLAVACFTKAFGIVFLGEPRHEIAKQAHEVGSSMVLPMALLATLCAAIGIFPRSFLIFLVGPVSVSAGISPGVVARQLDQYAGPLTLISLSSLVLIAAIGIVVLFRAALLRRRVVREAGTWDCGYIAPNNHMQYTASSFAAPILDFFSLLLNPREKAPVIRSFFPTRTAFRSRIFDLFGKRFYRPPVLVVQNLIQALHKFQPAKVHFFAGYIIVTLLGIIIWNYFVGAAL